MDFQGKHESFGLVCCLLLVREFSFFEKIDICAVVTDSGFVLIFSIYAKFQTFCHSWRMCGKHFRKPPLPTPPPKLICFGLLLFCSGAFFLCKIDIFLSQMVQVLFRNFSNFANMFQKTLFSSVDNVLKKTENINKSGLLCCSLTDRTGQDRAGQDRQPTPGAKSFQKKKKTTAFSQTSVFPSETDENDQKTVVFISFARENCIL